MDYFIVVRLVFVYYCSVAHAPYYCCNFRYCWLIKLFRTSSFIQNWQNWNSYFFLSWGWSRNVCVLENYSCGRKKQPALTSVPDFFNFDFNLFVWRTLIIDYCVTSWQQQILNWTVSNNFCFEQILFWGCNKTILLLFAWCDYCITLRTKLL